MGVAVVRTGSSYKVDGHTQNIADTGEHIPHTNRCVRPSNVCRVAVYEVDGRIVMCTPHACSPCPTNHDGSCLCRLARVLCLCLYYARLDSFARGTTSCVRLASNHSRCGDRFVWGLQTRAQIVTSCPLKSFRTAATASGRRVRAKAQLRA